MTHLVIYVGCKGTKINSQNKYSYEKYFTNKKVPQISQIDTNELNMLTNGFCPSTNYYEL